MSVPMLDLGPQHRPLDSAFKTAFAGLLGSGRFVLGEAVAGFEQALARYLGVGSVVGVSSGTDALLAAMMAVGVGSGDEVVTTPFTFVATASTIWRLGARPRFVDIEPDTFNIDPDQIEAAITKDTRAIVPVHLFGQPCSMGRIVDIARPRKLFIIEDAAQALGARDNGAPVGVACDIACFSFYPTKNLSAMGDAGACSTGSPQLAERLRQLRQHGEVARYHHADVGGNFRIDALQAAVLSLKLPHLDLWNDQRRDNAKRYDQLLRGLPIGLPRQREGAHHVYHQYTIRIGGGERDRLAEHLSAKGVGHAVHYPVPLHLQPCFADLGYRRGDLPVAEQAAGEVLSLPIYPGLSGSQQEEVAAAVRGFFQ